MEKAEKKGAHGFMKQKSIKINAILNALKTVLGILFPMITFPYVSRILQVDGIGLYNFSNSIVSYFLLLAGLGISTYAIREGVKYREDKTRIKIFLSEVYSINIWSTLLSYACLILAVHIFEKLQNYSLAIGILAIEIIFTTIGTSWVCNIYEDFFYIALQSVLVHILSLVLTFLFVKTVDDLYIYIGIIAFSRSIVFLLNRFYINHRYIKIRFTFKCNIKKHIKPIIIIFSTSIAIIIYVSADTTMLGLMTDDYQVGLYSAAVKIYTIAKTIIVAVLMVLIPRFSILLQQERKEEANRLFSNVFNVLIVLLFPVAFGLFLVSEDLIHLIGGVEFLGGAMSLRLLSIAILFSLIAYLYTQCVLIPKKKETLVFKATAISASVNILLNFWCIPLLGIDGAAITTIIAEAIVCIMVVVNSKEHIHLENIWGNLVSVVIGCFAIFFVCHFFSYIIDHYVYRLILTVTVSVIAYIFILVITKNAVILDFFVNVKKRITMK